MKKQNHLANLTNILHYAFYDLFQSIWKFINKRQSRFRLFAN